MMLKRILRTIGRAGGVSAVPIRALLFGMVACTLGLPLTLQAQRSQRGQPKTPFGLADFAKLRWLEGSWAASAPGQTPFYERCHFANDSTIEITYYRDSTLAQPTGTGRLYLTVGRVYNTFGPNRWGATHIGEHGAFFVPQVSARNSFAWSFHSPDSWTSTSRNGVSGHERVVVWEMRRLATGAQ